MLPAGWGFRLLEGSIQLQRKRRSLWGSISTSEKADLLPDTDFLLYLLIIPHCDDEGRMQGKPKTVKNKTCPGRTWTAGRIEKMLCRLDEVELIEYYAVNGSRYIQVTQWEEHQTFHGITREKSRYPTNNGLGTQPSLVKNSTNPGSKRSEVKGSKDKGSEYTSEFEEFWQSYPKKREKPGAFKKWNVLLKAKVDPQLLIRCSGNYALECEQEERLAKYTKLPATFLGPSRPYEDYTEGIPDTNGSKVDPDERKEYVRQYREGERNGTLMMDKEKRQVIVVETGERWMGPGSA